ncbi:dipeptidase PepE [Abyssalbus ytuae]|uniref:Dipeptidase PepE n=1 Tax=Abyssalbus ytuae TaxID=2926907 RepID=A0A9E7D2N8_9FLAO|nr:dipeptidase PepE [Abyssalbus ytuae]UOB18353.1 dipeptidase PepE [Abyssalbus ytuae]
MKKLIIASTSTVHGSTYLEYILNELSSFFSTADEIIFIPYARPGGITHDEYTDIAKKGFEKINKKIVGIHTQKDPDEALKAAKGIFVGGGNTFLLVHDLYKYNIMQTLRETVYKGTPYFGTSAGANITGVTMQTTNDMPIIYPAGFKTLGAVPFNINPHYQDPDPNSKHMGETRETRIKEFHKFNSIPVIGLREGSWIRVNDNNMVLKGKYSARVFEQNKEAYEIETGSLISF